MKKIVIDTSIIDSTYQSFLKYAKGNTMILSDLTFEELQDREKDAYCMQMSKSFAKKIIRYFAEPIIHEVDYKTETIKLEKESNHVDHALVMWAQKNEATIYTGDYGMVLDCRFNQVPIIWAEHSSIVKLIYVQRNNESLQLNLSKIPFGISVFVLDENMELAKCDEENKINLIDDDEILEIKPDEDGQPILTIYNVKPGTTDIAKVDEKTENELNSIEQKYVDKWKRYRATNK